MYNKTYNVYLKFKEWTAHTSGVNVYLRRKPCQERGCHGRGDEGEAYTDPCYDVTHEVSWGIIPDEPNHRQTPQQHFLAAHSSCLASSPAAFFTFGTLYCKSIKNKMYLSRKQWKLYAWKHLTYYYIYVDLKQNNEIWLK
jgi:hypothetical protein